MADETNESVPLVLDPLSISDAGPPDSELSKEEKERKLNQATFFHCIEEHNAKTLQVLLKTKAVDINALNEEGLTGLHIAVSTFEKSRNTDIVKTLLQAGADVNKKGGDKAMAKIVNIVRADPKHERELETARIKVDHLTPLLLALDLKSSLYVKGWEYRHWDTLLSLLAAATIKQASDADVHAATQEPGQPHTDSLASIQKGWAAVFDTGVHDLVEVRAEGKEVLALKQILTHASKRWKHEIESQEHAGRSSFTRTALHLAITEASYNVIRHVLRYLYSGLEDDEFLKSRGVDLFLAAHKYEIHALKELSEKKLHITQENWIKVLSAATAADSSLLTLRVAQSIKHLLDRRFSFSDIRRPSFSYLDHPPHQLFRKSEDELPATAE